MHQDNEKMKQITKHSFIIITMLTAFFSAVFLWYWYVSSAWSEGYKGYMTLTCVGGLFCFIYWIFAKMYNAHKIGLYRLTELIYSQFLAFVIADVILHVELIIWFHGYDKIRIWVGLLILIAQLIITTVAAFICNRLFARNDAPRKTVIIYGSEDYKDFLANLYRIPYRYEVVGCLSDTTDFEKLSKAVDECKNIYLYQVNPELKRKMVLYCSSKEKDIHITQEVDELLMRGFDVSHTFDTPFIRTKRVAVAWYYPFVKRAIDIICSSVALLVLSPILLIVALLIKLYDGGPVFYKQIRLTKGHREFEIYKFRSMIVDAEKNGARLASQNDDRITPIGKFIRMTRIDELPQLLNILKGDMTIVGPRPERPEIEKEYLENLPEFGLRLQVPAGLTGYAQVFGKYNTTPENKLKLDLMYINQRSVLLDFKLIFYTIKIVFVPESTEGVSTVTIYGADEKEETE